MFMYFFNGWCHVSNCYGISISLAISKEWCNRFMFKCQYVGNSIVCNYLSYDRKFVWHLKYVKRGMLFLGLLLRIAALEYVNKIVFIRTRLLPGCSGVVVQPCVGGKACPYATTKTWCFSGSSNRNVKKYHILIAFAPSSL